MKRLHILAIVALIFLGVFAVLKWGVHPRTKPLIKLSQFESIEQMGQSGFQAWHKYLIQTRALAIGVPLGEETSRNIAGQFIRSLLKTSSSFKLFSLVDPEYLPMVPLGQEWTVLDVRTADFAELELRIDAVVDENDKIIVYGPAEMLSHLVEDRFLKDWEDERATPFTVISFIKLAQQATELKSLRPVCLTTEVSERPMWTLGCLAYKKSEIIMRKKKDPASYWAVFEQIGAKDFVFFWLPPQFSGGEG